jgi:hypothetical protein
MTSLTPTLLDPYEVSWDAEGSGVRLRLQTFEDETLWFERASLDLDGLALIEEISETPPWTPEPIDRRWRGRAWGEDD